MRKEIFVKLIALFAVLGSLVGCDSLLEAYPGEGRWNGNEWHFEGEWQRTLAFGDQEAENTTGQMNFRLTINELSSGMFNTTIFHEYQEADPEIEVIHQFYSLDKDELILRCYLIKENTEQESVYGVELFVIFNLTEEGQCLCTYSVDVDNKENPKVLWKEKGNFLGTKK